MFLPILKARKNSSLANSYLTCRDICSVIVEYNLGKPEGIKGF